MNSQVLAPYNEIDFLLPAQRFNIQYSYVTKHGLPFIREFVLRIVHVAPMTKKHLLIYLGLSKREVNEAVSDLIGRDELQINTQGLLILTAKSQDYFIEIGEIPQLSAIFDSGATLTFELAGYTCLGNNTPFETWKNGISLTIDNSTASQSEALAEKSFQQRFHEIIDKGYLSKKVDDGDTKPTIYTVNSINKLRQVVIRLNTEFSIDKDGVPVERDDFEDFNDSESIHNLITSSLSENKKMNNIESIANAMSVLEDTETATLMNVNSIDLTLFLHKRAHEDNGTNKKRTILGQLYSNGNWNLFLELLSPLIESRIKNKSTDASDRFIWIAPSDPYWGKSSRCAASISDIVSKARTKHKSLFTPVIFVPMHSEEDRMKNYWSRELNAADKYLHGLREGFLGGDVEVLYLENEIVAVNYHISKPDSLPVSLPLGFISTDKNIIKLIGRLVNEYIDGQYAYDKPNNLGAI